MTTTSPFVLEVTATATAQVLVHAPDIDTADDIMSGRFDELQAALIRAAGLPSADSHEAGYVLYDYDVRDATYAEAVPSPGNARALHPDLPTFKVCTCAEQH